MPIEMSFLHLMKDIQLNDPQQVLMHNIHTPQFQRVSLYGASSTTIIC